MLHEGRPVVPIHTVRGMDYRLEVPRAADGRTDPRSLSMIGTSPVVVATSPAMKMPALRMSTWRQPFRRSRPAAAMSPG
ncbi:MAG: hypothetical protein ACK54X_10490 [Burkholderiales bacterium]|jgi:hypothetical protein